jgi:hypothetical protein
MANSPAELTVIYPLIELREDTISPLRSWTRDQTLARERYRVIAVFAEADRAQAAAMEPLLGPNDELLPVPDRGFAALINAARGEDQTHAICDSQIPPRGQGNRRGTRGQARGQSNRQRARQTARPQNAEHLPGMLSFAPEWFARAFSGSVASSFETALRASSG